MVVNACLASLVSTREPKKQLSVLLAGLDTTVRVFQAPMLRSNAELVSCVQQELRQTQSLEMLLLCLYLLKEVTLTFSPPKHGSVLSVHTLKK